MITLLSCNHPRAGRSFGPGPVGPADFSVLSLLDIQVGVGSSWLISGSCNQTPDFRIAVAVGRCEKNAGIGVLSAISFLVQG